MHNFRSSTRSFFSFLSATLLLLGFLTQSTSAFDNDRFQHWTHSYKEKFTEIVQTNCSSEFQAYLASDSGGGARKETCITTLSCILSNSDERTKAVLGGATVILGLTPTILILLGPTSAETALLSMYRPALALLLSFGSPSSNPLHSIEYRTPIDDYIKEKAGRIVLHARLNPSLDFLIVVIEVILAMACAALVMVTSWELGFKTVSVIWCDKWFGPLLWAALSIFIFGLAYAAMAVRVTTHPKSSPLPKSRRQGLFRRVRREFTTCRNHEPSVITWGNETLVFAGLEWLVSFCSVAHLAFGTFALSTLTFISAGDAITMMARYMAAAIISRMICAYELAGLRQTLEVEDQRTPYSDRKVQ